MSALLWVAGAILCIPILAILVAWYLRAANPHSRKMAHEQEQLSNKKTGTNGSPSAPVTTSKSKTGEGFEWFKSNLVAALLVIAGAGIFWGLYTPGLRLSQVGDWSWDHSILLLALWGVIIGLIALNAKALGATAKTLQKVLTGVMLMLFIGIPAGFWVRDAFLPQVICKDVSAHETRSCFLNTAWSSWIKFAEGPENNGMQICFTPGGQFERTDVNGTTFWRFKAHEGRLVKAYRLFPADVKCPATLP